MHYLDNSATTQVLEEAAKCTAEVMTADYGNPSSLHTLGVNAKNILDSSREEIAKKLHVQRDEIYFTSGGTEGNNLAIFGAVGAKRRLGNKVVTTAAEHPSVLKAVKELERFGIECVYVESNSDGNIDEEKLYNAVDNKTILVTAMLVNNETGAVFPVKAAANAIKRKKSPALLHVDAVQAFGKMDFSPVKLGADLCTVSGHKMHAPKGIGALYMQKGKRILPQVFGGGQEKGLRPGTESMPLIAAFGEAARQIPSYSQGLEYAQNLNDLLRSELSKIDGVSINSPCNALPYILNFTAGRVKAETMLHFLAEREVYVSAGSACGKARPSHVLAAMKLSKERIDSSLRVSFSRFNIEEDVFALVNALNEGLNTLRHN